MEKEQVGVLTQHNLKIYYKAAVIKTVSVGKKIDIQSNRIQSPEIYQFSSKWIADFSVKLERNTDLIIKIKTIKLFKENIRENPSDFCKYFIYRKQKNYIRKNQQSGEKINKLD